MPRKKTRDGEESYSLARRMAELALTKKAEDVVILNMNRISGFTDYFVICHGIGELQVKAISDAVEDGLAEDKVKSWHREGYENRKWILLDYVDVVFHVFDRDSREFYGLERLWGDAEREIVEDQVPLAASKH